MFKIAGKITYDPPRNVKTQWWLTVEIPKFYGEAEYQRWLIDRNWCESDSSWTKRKYCMPNHPYHVSIIRGERPKKNIKQWGKYLAGQKVLIEYDTLIRQTTMAKDGKDTIWFVDGTFDGYNDMRDYFGLDTSRNGIPFKGHITIAKVNT